MNSKIERLNGTVRDREVVMCGMDHKESAQELREAMRIYTITTSSHIKGLDGKTPAEASGIKFESLLNRWLVLIQNARNLSSS